MTQEYCVHSVEIVRDVPADDGRKEYTCAWSARLATIGENLVHENLIINNEITSATTHYMSQFFVVVVVVVNVNNVC